MVNKRATCSHIHPLKELRQEMSCQNISDIQEPQTYWEKKKSLTTFCYCFNSAQHELSLSKTMKPSLHREVLYLHLLLSVNGASLAFMHMAPPMCVFVSILKMVSPPQLPVLLHSTQGSPYILKKTTNYVWTLTRQEFISNNGNSDADNITHHHKTKWKAVNKTMDRL